MDRASAGKPLQPALDRLDDADAVEAELARARARFQQSLEALHTRFDELKDWRAWLRRHPVPFLLGAATLGALLGWHRRDP